MENSTILSNTVWTSVVPFYGTTEADYVHESRGPSSGPFSPALFTELTDITNTSVNETVDDYPSYYYDYEHFADPIWYMTLLSLIFGILIVLTVVGNIFVMIAYVQDVRIKRNVANAFILNLAVADFIVGVFIWPIYLGWNLVGVWIFGEYLCKVWSFVDYTVTAMSVVTIILISLDRYWMLSKKTRYTSYQTPLRVNVTTLICWIFVSAVFLTLIFGFSPITKSYSVNYRFRCDAEFVYIFPALITAVVLNFVVPAIVIAVLNTLVYYKIQARAKGLSVLQSKVKEGKTKNTKFALNILRRKKANTLSTEAKGDKGVDSGVILVTISNKSPTECHQNPAFDKNAEITPSSSSGTSGIESAPDENSDISDDEIPENDTSPKNTEVPKNTKKKAIFSISTRGNGKEKPGNPGKGSMKMDGLKKKLDKKRREFKRERRAAFILAVLVTVFILCWLPFNLTVIVGVICEYKCIPEKVFVVTENLVWANSALNPILYAATNVHFKRNFLRFLGFRKLARKYDRTHSNV